MRFIKWILSLIGLVVILIMIYAYTHAEEYVTSMLKKSLPAYVEMHHSPISIDLFRGNISISNIEIDVMNNGDMTKYAFVQMRQVKLEGFSYLKYVFQGKVYVKNISILEPFCTIYPELRNHFIDSSQSVVNNQMGPILLDHFEISNGHLLIMQENSDSIKMATSAINLELFHLKTDAALIHEKIPFTYEEINMLTSQIQIDLGNFEKMLIDQIVLKNNQVILSNLAIHSKYSKQNLLSHLDQEREHITIDIPVIQMDGIDYGFEEEQFYLRAPLLKLGDSEMVFHLDKRLKDRTKIKPMYSKLIRELPFDLVIDSVFLHNTRIAYEEKKDAAVKEGIIYFDKVNAEIFNLSNVYPKGQNTIIHATGRIMGGSPVELDWSFDITNENDDFTLSGSASDFNAASINQFLDANVKTTVVGQVDQLYFSVSGNDKHAQGDMKIKYNNLKIEIQKDDRSGKHAVKSWVGNLFVNSGKHNDEKGYRHGKISIDRNRQKPFFNFLWLNIKDGLMNSVRENITK